MLPFLKNKQVATLIRSQRGQSAQDLKPEMVTQSDGMPDGLMAVSEDLLKALEDKSAHGVAAALRKVYELCDVPAEEMPE